MHDLVKDSVAARDQLVRNASSREYRLETDRAAVAGEDERLGGRTVTNRICGEQQPPPRLPARCHHRPGCSGTTVRGRGCRIAAPRMTYRRLEIEAKYLRLRNAREPVDDS